MLPKKCPVGGPKKRNRTPKKNLEGIVVSTCLQALHDCPDVIYVERRNTGSLEIEGGGFVSFGSPGAADIWCLVNTKRYHMASDDHGNWVCSSVPTGHIIHIEVEAKRRDGKGHQSVDQKKFQEFCNSNGIPYLLVTSAEQLKQKIKAIVLDES